MAKKGSSGPKRQPPSGPKKQTPSANKRAPSSGVNRAPSAGTRAPEGNKNKPGNKSKGKGTELDFLGAFADKLTNKKGVRQLTSPTLSNSVEALLAAWQQNFAETYAANRETTELAIAQGDNQTRLSLGQMNLQGVLGQAEATKFAASEGARGQIESSRLMSQAQMETQRIASASEERQIGLTGLETRKTNEQSEMFRRYKEAKDQSDALRAFRA